MNFKTNWTKTVDDYIREYAFRVYENRIVNNLPGDDVSDWIEGKRQYEDACEQAREQLAAAIWEEIRQEEERFFQRIIAYRKMYNIEV